MNASMKRLALLACMFMILPAYAFTQTDTSDLHVAIKELGLTLAKSEQRKVDKATSLMDNASTLLEKARNAGKNSGAYSFLKQASSKYESALHTMKGLYESALKDFYDKANPIMINKFDHARYYDQRAEGYASAADRVMQKLDSVKGVENYYPVYANAYENVKWAIINELRAVKVYQDFPLEYPYEWDDFFREHQIMLAREEASRYASHPELKQQAQQEAKETYRTIYFRVQIAAHTMRIPSLQLWAIYKGKVPIKEVYENGWYKYTIGNFERYDEALTLLKSCNVKKAFIVAYDEKNIRQDMKLLEKDKK